MMVTENAAHKISNLRVKSFKASKKFKLSHLNSNLLPSDEIFIIPDKKMIQYKTTMSNNSFTYRVLSDYGKITFTAVRLAIFGFVQVCGGRFRFRDWRRSEAK